VPKCLTRFEIRAYTAKGCEDFEKVSRVKKLGIKNLESVPKCLIF
jgi:hypothetical protein